MKRRIIAALMVTVAAVAMMPATAMAHHGGGHHGGGHHGGYQSQATYTAPAPTYTAPAQTYTAPAQTNTVATAPVVAPVCTVEGCTTIGEHVHEDGCVVTHYYGDGHDCHTEYDHYYGDGHDYHDQCGHYYGDGHDHHNDYCY